MIYELISKVLINVLLISIFICIFFFTYGVHIEKITIKNQMSILANNFMNFFELSGRNSNNNLYNNIKNNLLSKENIEKISEGDAEALKGNKKLLEDVMWYILGFILVVSFIISILVFSGKLKNLVPILIECLIILVFIGLTEYCFLTYYGAKYISLDMNHLKLGIAESLQEYSKAL
jgi:hypothetical protein